MDEREYRDQEGNVVTLDKLVRIEPEWAANIIRHYESKLDARDAQLAAMKGGPVTCEKHSWVGDDECAYCKIDELSDMLAANLQIVDYVQLKQRAAAAECKLRESERRLADAYRDRENVLADWSATKAKLNEALEQEKHSDECWRAQCEENEQLKSKLETCQAERDKYERWFYAKFGEAFTTGEEMDALVEGNRELQSRLEELQSVIRGSLMTMAAACHANGGELRIPMRSIQAISTDDRIAQETTIDGTAVVFRLCERDAARVVEKLTPAESPICDAGHNISIDASY